jgi:protein-S-isoprenylcysteine O-methyltransferase Ste14
MLTHLPDVLFKVKNPALFLSFCVRLLFETYWTVAAKASSPAKSSESRKSRQLHVFLVNVAFILLYVPVPGLNQRFLPDASLVVRAGLIVQMTFTLLGVWARRHLGSNWSGEIAIKLDHRLIHSGPCKWVRHPIYTAILGMSAGTAIISGQLHAALALVIVVLAYWRKIRLEEASLSKAFGPAYDAYRRDTWALVPGLL